MLFYLGTDRTNWLWDPRFADVPLFVSHRALRCRKTRYPRAVTRYAVDSAAYGELVGHGRWKQTPQEYVGWLRRYWTELGPFDYAAGQDWLCTPDTLTATGLTVAEHQTRTVANLIALRELAPELPIIPTLQGTCYDEWLTCVRLYADAGIDLTTEPVVGLGSIVPVTPTVLERVATSLHDAGITTLHGFGVKGRQLDAASHVLERADSMAWSYTGRRDPDPTHLHRSCAHCADYALAWRTRQVARHGRPRQLGFAI